jgi:hypothetical protein
MGGFLHSAAFHIFLHIPGQSWGMITRVSLVCLALSSHVFRVGWRKKGTDGMEGWMALLDGLFDARNSRSLRRYAGFVAIILLRDKGKLFAEYAARLDSCVRFVQMIQGLNGFSTKLVRFLLLLIHQQGCSLSEDNAISPSILSFIAVSLIEARALLVMRARPHQGFSPAGIRRGRVVHLRKPVRLEWNPGKVQYSTVQYRRFEELQHVCIMVSGICPRNRLRRNFRCLVFSRCI